MWLVGVKILSIPISLQIELIISSNILTNNTGHSMEHQAGKFGGILAIINEVVKCQSCLFLVKLLHPDSVERFMPEVLHFLFHITRASEF